MNDAYLEKAKEVIEDPKILCVIASKRSKQLARGARPMVKCDKETNHLDIALQEIAEGMIDVGEEADADLGPDNGLEKVDAQDI